MTMSQTDLTKLLKTTWKALAKADKDEADQILPILEELLEKLESFEVE
jgi:hypothetical protein